MRQVIELKSRKIETSNASATKELKIDQLQSNMIAQENLILREQIKMLEQKCRNFEEKVSLRNFCNFFFWILIFFKLRLWN